MAYANSVFWQLFGGTEILITSDQLIYALRHKHEKNQTMAAMALSLGYMTEEETEDVHNMQVICDEEFISLALRMNYLTSSQAAELEEAQHFGLSASCKVCSGTWFL